MPLPFSVNGRQAGAGCAGRGDRHRGQRVAVPADLERGQAGAGLAGPQDQRAGQRRVIHGPEPDPGGAGPGVGDAGERGAAQVDHVGGTARAQVDDLGPHLSAGALHGEVAAAGGAAAEPLRRQAHIAPAGRKGAERATAQRIARVIEHRHGRRPSQVAAAARGARWRAWPAARRCPARRRGRLAPGRRPAAGPLPAFRCPRARRSRRPRRRRPAPLPRTARRPAISSSRARACALTSAYPSPSATPPASCQI